MGIKVSVVPRDDLLLYKKILQRPEDLLDIQDIENQKSADSKESKSDY